MPARPNMRMGDQNTYKHGTNNVECDRTGFKRKATDCEFEWNNFFVWEDFWEERPLQDFLRGFPDRQSPEVSRPGTGDRFLQSPITADDL